ncbi:hypothetical protein EYF80_042452 [Liparis tanakae]|uniref:Uncharacterized protein n=1 Tax=Liparis tanakae TaxID=230148 RepID=A0A4Z2G3B1_9TELE|nr:hypothetical protein EYF80_042452 [Liparis tanakae]
MTCQKGTIPRVIDVAAHPRVLVETQVRAHPIKVIAVTIADEVIGNGPPAICELFRRIRQASVWKTKVIGGVAIEDATQTASNIVEEGGEGDVKESLASVLNTKQSAGLHHCGIAWCFVDHHCLHRMDPAHLHLNHRAISWHCTAKLQQVVGAVIWDGQGGAIKGGGVIKAGDFPSKSAGAAEATFTFLTTGACPESVIKRVIEVVVLAATVIELNTAAAAENEALVTLTALGARDSVTVHLNCDISKPRNRGDPTVLIFGLDAEERQPRHLPAGPSQQEWRARLLHLNSSGPTTEDISRLMKKSRILLAGSCSRARTCFFRSPTVCSRRRLTASTRSPQRTSTRVLRGLRSTTARGASWPYLDTRVWYLGGSMSEQGL